MVKGSSTTEGWGLEAVEGGAEGGGVAGWRDPEVDVEGIREVRAWGGGGGREGVRPLGGVAWGCRGLEGEGR